MWRLAALLLITLAAAGLPPLLPGRNCPVPSRNQLLTCVGFMDGNADDTITAAEIDTFMTQHAECIPAAVRTALTGANVITACDTDASGNLTSTDWDAANGCFQLPQRQLMLCRACDRCGLLNPILKKSQHQ
jgi:hypothetical protein